MTDYTTITDAQVAPGSKGTSALFTALRDNIVSLSEGGPGAPRILNEAFANFTLGAENFQIGTTESSWVLFRMAGGAAGGVGTYAFLAHEPTGTGNGVLTVAPGTNVSGSLLNFSNDAATYPAGTVTGTWQCMGYLSVGETTSSASMFLRVA